MHMPLPRTCRALYSSVCGGAGALLTDDHHAGACATVVRGAGHSDGRGRGGNRGCHRDSLPAAGMAPGGSAGGLLRQHKRTRFGGEDWCREGGPTTHHHASANAHASDAGPAPTAFTPIAACTVWPARATSELFRWGQGVVAAAVHRAMSLELRAPATARGPARLWALPLTRLPARQQRRNMGRRSAHRLGHQARDEQHPSTLPGVDRTAPHLAALRSA